MGADDLDPFASENLVEGAIELAVAVVDQEPCRRSLGECPAKLTGLLGRPVSVGVRGAAREVHAPTVELDEEEHIEASEPERLDREEVAGDDRMGVGTQEPPSVRVPRARLYGCKPTPTRRRMDLRTRQVRPAEQNVVGDLAESESVVDLLPIGLVCNHARSAPLSKSERVANDVIAAP